MSATVEPMPVQNLSVLLLTAPAPMGGLETVVATLAAGLAEAGHHVTLAQLLTPEAKPAMPFSSLHHVNIEHVLLRRDARDYVGARNDVRALLAARSGVVLHSHGARADLVAALAVRGASGFVSTVHGFITNTVKQRVARRIHLLILRRASRVIAVSAVLSRQLATEVGASRVVTIPNCAPRTEGMSRAAARLELGIAEAHTPVLGWVGRASEEKGLDIFVEAFSQLHDRSARAVVMGEGPTLSTVQARANALGLGQRIRWLGAVPGAARLFAGLDLLVLSSRTEGTPMTVLEAIQSHVPVVAAAVGGVPDLLTGNAGWLVPSEDPMALAAAIDAALADPAEARARALSASERLDARNGMRTWIASHERLYASLGAA